MVSLEEPPDACGDVSTILWGKVVFYCLVCTVDPTLSSSHALTSILKLNSITFHICHAVMVKVVLEGCVQAGDVNQPPET